MISLPLLLLVSGLLGVVGGLILGLLLEAALLRQHYRPHFAREERLAARRLSPSP
jgi:hypothetical protein